MGQVVSSTGIVPEKLYDGPRLYNTKSFHGKSATGVAISAPGKRSIEKLEDSMRVGSKFQRHWSLEGEKQLEISEEGNARELIAELLLKLLAPEKSLFEKPKRAKRILPELEGSYFRFGEEPADQEFVIYLRLDGCGDILLERYHRPGSKTEISISLTYNEDEFHERRVPFESILPTLDAKFSVKCNEQNSAVFLKNLSSKIQILVEPEEHEKFKPVLESENICFGSLVHTMASLSLCEISDVKGDPESAHHVSCYVFLDQPFLSSEQSSKNSGNFCTNCTEGSHLMTVFNQIKRSPGRIIELASPDVAATLMEIDLTDMVNSRGDDNFDNECTEPADLSFKKMTTVETVVEIVPENLPSLLEHETTRIETVIKKVSSGTQTPENSVKETASKADAKLRKMMTTKPIKRKHKGLSREVYLLNKVKEMEQRLLALKQQQTGLPENESQVSTSRSDLLLAAEVPSNPAPTQSPLPVTRSFILIQNPDGSNSVMPAIPLRSVANEALTPVANSTTSSEEKLYKCTEAGCAESFNNKSSLSRHRKKVHFPNKLHKCYNCGHQFPRPYMLQRHLDCKVCFNKDAPKSSASVLAKS